MDTEARHTIVVAGASGVVGQAVVQLLGAQPDRDVVAVSRRRPPGIEHATFLSVDLSDARACHDALTSIGPVTHLVYAAVKEAPGLSTGWTDTDLMQANCDMLRHALDPIEPTLQHVSLLQGGKAYGFHLGPVAIPARERWPRHPHPDFYFLQEDLLRERAARAAWHWTIWRPQAVFGDAQGSNMNPIAALGAYGALLRASGEPLHFPGRGSRLYQAIDAELLARAIDWGTRNPQALDEVFNVTNGDVFVWRNVWPAIADALGMEVGDDRPARLADELPPRAGEWAAIVDRHDLRAPRELERFVGQSLRYLDLLLDIDGRDQLPPAIVSTVKVHRAGFAEFLDTEDMFRAWFRRLQDRRLLPPA